MKALSSSIKRGIVYSLIYYTVAWIIFMVFMHTPSWNSAYTVFVCPGIWFLISVPFYFILKNDCDKMYLSTALGTLIFLTMAFIQLSQFDQLLPRSLVHDLFPHSSDFIYLRPIIYIPIIGAIPIAIDALLYLFKWIWKLLGNRKSI